MNVWLAVVAILAAVSSVTSQDTMYGTGGQAWSQTGGSSSSSSSSSSSGGGSVSNSAISQSQPGGWVDMQCGSVGERVWFRQDGAGRRELARNGQLISAPSRYRLQHNSASDILTINPAETSDTGVFICETRSSAGYTSTHTYKLTIGSGVGTGGGGNGASSRTAAGAAAGVMGAMMLLL